MTKERLRFIRIAGIVGLVGIVAAAAWFFLVSNSNSQSKFGKSDPLADAKKKATEEKLLFRYGKVETTVTSKYSRIRIRKKNDTVSMMFIRDSGEEVLESRVNMKRTHDLLVDYTRYMFLSYLFKPKHEKVLIVGLGGGGMVHFMKHHDPKCQVDCVEIDPEVVRLAGEYF